MSEIYESSRPLDHRHIGVIESQIQKGAHAILNGIEDYGSWGYYLEVSEQVLPEFIHVAKEVSKTLNWPVSEITDTEHPFATAIERGLVVGSVLGTEALNNSERIAFLEDSEDALTLLAWSIKRSPYDIEELMRRGGSGTRKMLECKYSPEIFEYELDDEDARRDLLYADTMGYMGALAITNFTRLQIRRSQLRDRKAASEMLDVARRLSHPSTSLTTRDIEF